MNRLLQIATIVAAVCLSSATLAQKSTQDLVREIEASNRATQLEIEQSRLRLQQMEAETERRRFETESLRADTNLLRMLESQAASDRAKEVAERAEQLAQKQMAATKKAEEAAEELRSEMEQAAIRTRNQIYLGVFILAVVGFAWNVIRNSRNEEPMKEHQKIGIVIFVCSILGMVWAVMISDGWAYYYDFLQSLMSSLRIRLFGEHGCTVSCSSYAVDFPTKYAVLACLCSAAYGFTTYLGVTPVPKVPKF